MEFIFKCLKCKRVVPINKPLVDYTPQERCPFCRVPMTRIYTPPIIIGETSVHIQDPWNDKEDK